MKPVSQTLPLHMLIMTANLTGLDTYDISETHSRMCLGGSCRCDLGTVLASGLFVSEAPLPCSASLLHEVSSSAPLCPSTKMFAS